NVNANPDIDKEKRKVSFTFLIDPGRRVYVRRINVVGNARTRDEVVRREMRQLEGSFFDSQKLQLSKQRIDKTGYFSEVEVETPAVPGTTDQVDVTVRVKEKPTGAVLLGVGFSNVDKLIIQASVPHRSISSSPRTARSVTSFFRTSSAPITLRWSPPPAGSGTRGTASSGRREVTSSVPLWSWRRRPETSNTGNILTPTSIS